MSKALCRVGSLMPAVRAPGRKAAIQRAKSGSTPAAVVWVDWVDESGFVAGGGLVRGAGVGEHELVLTVVVLEEVVEAFLLEQALDEVQVALAVLHQVVPDAVLGAQQHLEIAHAVLTEEELRDLGHALVVEDAAVAVLAQKPEPGAQGGAVAGVVAVLPHLRKLGDDAVELPQRAVRALERDGGVLAEQLREIERVFGAQQIDLVGEQLAERFATGHRVEREALSQGAREHRRSRQKHISLSTEPAERCAAQPRATSFAAPPGSRIHPPAAKASSCGGGSQAYSSR